MKNKPIVIGVGGYARAGKDTFVKIAINIVNQNGYQGYRLAFADALKNEIDPFLKEQYDISAWTENSEEKTLIRPLLIAHGCQKRLQTKGKYWIDKIDQAIDSDKKFNNNSVIFVSDCRFPNEVDWVHDKWSGWFVHLKKYNISGGMQHDSFTGKQIGYKEWRQFDDAPNEEEAKNDPICEKHADYNLELENVTEREKRSGNKINLDQLIHNTYLNEEITLCLKNCPFLKLK